MHPDLSPFMTLRRFLAIAHHVPGRIRVKLDPAALMQLPIVDTGPFVALAKRIPGVKAIRVNAAALSAVIEYDAGLIAAPVWERLLAGDRAEIEEILRNHSA
ncbi:MAG: hypothetical protein ACOYJQ_11880 [Pseudochelatococcus sp.]|jgi:hypothetical protein|uniref:hypothetical protein n=1 Tax=Pseudochelatococcus sp. TaxID=2020869 RepID=UPI003D93D8E1